ncbi:hypothetical protein [Claveliimonas monacensis]|uniref:hypothetical protein n=1 Tax=Claveliimonas monacensis TaxID=2779351 RepID=UPI002ED63371
MRKDFGAKPFLFPQPVMIIGTYDEEGKANQQGIHCQHGRRGTYDSLRLRGACVWQQGRKQDGEGRIYHNRKRLRPCVLSQNWNKTHYPRSIIIPEEMQISA